MKLAGALITLITGLAISVIAGFISVYGMMQLFAFHAGIVGLMIGAIEVGKLVAATWLKFYWKDKVVPFLHKTYLIIAVFLTMVITSLGVFGFLSAGYVEQNAPNANIQAQVAPLELKIKQEEAENEFLTKRLVQIDQNIGAFLSNDQASRGLSASKTLKGERDKIQAQIDQNNKDINAINEQLLPLKMKSNDAEAKLGPVKYLTALLGWDDPEAAVRLVILLIMIPFDPLAVVLVLSGMITFAEWREERRKPKTMSDENFEGIKEGLEEAIDVTKPRSDYTVTSIKGAGDISITCEAEADTSLPATNIVIEDTVPIVCEANAVTAEYHWGKEQEGEEKPERTRDEILDLLEQNPGIVNEIIATIVNDLGPKKEEGGNSNATVTDLTGGRAD